MRHIYLEGKDIPEAIKAAFHDYSGKTFEARVCESVQLSGMYWDGGSRSSYRAVDLATGKVASATSDSTLPPQFGGPMSAPTVQIPPGVVIVEHCIFCDKDMGLRIYVRPEDMSPLLPSGGDAVTDDEATVIEYTCALKNTYGGRKEIRFTEAQAKTGITRERWDAAKEACYRKGYLNKAGSVTNKGRNVREMRRGK